MHCRLSRGQAQHALQALKGRDTACVPRVFLGKENTFYHFPTVKDSNMD